MNESHEDTKAQKMIFYLLKTFRVLGPLWLV
jgi:hypothetical protein